MARTSEAVFQGLASLAKGHLAGGFWSLSELRTVHPRAQRTVDFFLKGSGWQHEAIQSLVQERSEDGAAIRPASGARTFRLSLYWPRSKWPHRKTRRDWEHQFHG